MMRDGAWLEERIDATYDIFRMRYGGPFVARADVNDLAVREDYLAFRHAFFALGFLDAAAPAWQDAQHAARLAEATVRVAWCATRAVSDGHAHHAGHSRACAPDAAERLHAPYRTWCPRRCAVALHRRVHARVFAASLPVTRTISAWPARAAAAGLGRASGASSRLCARDRRRLDVQLHRPRVRRRVQDVRHSGRASSGRGARPTCVATHHGGLAVLPPRSDGVGGRAAVACGGDHQRRAPRECHATAAARRRAVEEQRAWCALLCNSYALLARAS